MKADLLDKIKERNRAFYLTTHGKSGSSANYDAVVGARCIVPLRAHVIFNLR
jgi:hypothetical protein